MSKSIYLLTNRDEKIYVDREDFKWLNQWKWYVNKGGYAARSVNLGKSENGKTKMQVIKMHRLITGATTGKQVDHKNGDKLDNRRGNLRFCTSQQNQQNRSTHYNKRFKGVNWHKRISSWQVSIRVNKQLKHIGYFENEVAAAKEYNKYATIYFGEFARLNNV